MIIKLTDIACEEIKKITKDTSGLGIQIVVYMGGCSGLSYDFKLGNKIDFDGDEIFSISGVYIFIKRSFQQYLIDRTLNYQVEIGQSYFELIHPKGVGRCGCGKSFGI